MFPLNFLYCNKWPQVSHMLLMCFSWNLCLVFDVLYFVYYIDTLCAAAAGID